MANEFLLSLGTPQHGWLPVELRLADFELEIEASSVLNNPLVEWIELLEHLVMHSPGVKQICLWLEPEGYLVDFKRTALADSGELIVTVSYHSNTAPPMDEEDLDRRAKSQVPVRSVRSALLDALSQFFERHTDSAVESGCHAPAAPLRRRVARIASAPQG